MKNKAIHFVGIGGIGMSALAQLYKTQGVIVSGSDRETSPVVELLLSKDFEVMIGHKEKNVPEGIDLLVYSDAVPKDNPERMYAKKMGVRELSYFEALGEATKEGTSIVISGTHGKTSTTAMVAKILIDAGKEPTVIAGSILSEYGSNFIEGAPDLFVIEGCEYRRHFLHLHPDVLVVTNIELDHTDYYKDLADMQDAFCKVISLVPENGTLVTNTVSDTIIPTLHMSHAKVVPYQKTTVPKLLLPGEFNLENARSAKTAVYALYPELHERDLDKSLSEFKGTWRRFEYKGATRNGAIVYDDYAHHPTSVKKTIEIAKSEFKDKQIIVVFHPHLYSRTKSFFDEFAEALSLADKSILLPIYAAREKKDKSVSSEELVKLINKKGGHAHYAETFEEAEKLLSGSNVDTVIFTMGAGDVYKLGDKICV